MRITCLECKFWAPNLTGDMKMGSRVDKRKGYFCHKSIHGGAHRHDYHCRDAEKHFNP